jgi:hypothetical protein
MSALNDAPHVIGLHLNFCTAGAPPGQANATEGGTDLTYLRQLTAYWRDRYDWRGPAGTCKLVWETRLRQTLLQIGQDTVGNLNPEGRDGIRGERLRRDGNGREQRGGEEKAGPHGHVQRQPTRCNGGIVA